ncbi:MAG: hypothetical protein RJA98_4055 [Pseudomonadota bacterium]
MFLHAHATHPDAGMALALAAAQIDAQRAAAPGFDATVGWVYLTEAYAPHAATLLAELRQRWPGVAWVGASGIGVAANGVEYIDEPALVLMLGDLPRHQFKVFSGAAPLGTFAASTALIHGDPDTPDLAELVLDMAERTSTGYLFGGLASGREHSVHLANGVFEGGLSGLALSEDVALISRVTQGSQPVGPARRVTAVDRNVVLTLDGEPALDVLLRDLGVQDIELREAVPHIRHTLVGLSDPSEAADKASVRRQTFGPEVRVRHLVGLDPARHGIAIADQAAVGQQLSFCQRHAEAARRDLVRICTEIREELEPEVQALETVLALQDSDAEQRPHPARRIRGAIYVSCNGRGGPHFGAPSAELATVRHALGDVPLVGFFAAGEIARHHLYGYTGVLTVFVAPGDD